MKDVGVWVERSVGWCDVVGVKEFLGWNKVCKRERWEV